MWMVCVAVAVLHSHIGSVRTPGSSSRTFVTVFVLNDRRIRGRQRKRVDIPIGWARKMNVTKED